MKAKDLINLIFKVEESKEVQESIFYIQYGMISSYFKEYYFNQYKEKITESLKEYYNKENIKEIDSKLLIELLVLEFNLNRNKIIN
jgi:histidinol phosphatase-like enzyme